MKDVPGTWKVMWCEFCKTPIPPDKVRWFKANRGEVDGHLLQDGSAHLNLHVALVQGVLKWEKLIAGGEGMPSWVIEPAKARKSLIEGYSSMGLTEEEEGGP